MLISKKIILSSLILVSLTLGLVMILNFTPEVEAASFFDRQGELKKIGTGAFGSETPQKGIQEIIARSIRVFLGFMGLVFLILLIMGGFKYMTSEGNEEKVGDAKKQITSSIVGLLIILSAWSIAVYVTECATDILSNGTIWLCR